MTDSASICLYEELRVARRRCLGFVQNAEPGELAICIGPSGAGKTLLSRSIGYLAYGAKSGWPKGANPYIRVQADNPDRGFFSPKELTRSMLVQLRDPFRSRPSEVLEMDGDVGLRDRVASAVVQMRHQKISEPEMRQVIASLGREQKLGLVVVDEANMLALTHLNRTPTDYIESLRTLGMKAGCRFILFGTTDLINLMGYSAQLNRSLRYIHLDRLRCESDHGKSEYLGLLTALEEKWSLEPGLLAQNAAKVYEWTYGIPGEADSLIKRANELHPDLVSRPSSPHSSGALSPISWKDIVSQRPHPEVSATIREEADLIYKVVNHVPLSSDERRYIGRRKQRRMKARRIKGPG